MEEAVRTFPQQFTFEPVVERGEALTGTHEHVVVSGMGGSHLSAGILQILRPQLSVEVHSDYGLPQLSDRRAAKTLVIVSSYSGNTEEVLDAFETAHARGLECLCIATGGRLKDRAEEVGAPFIQLPATGIQPRSALGYSTLALATALGDRALIGELHALSAELNGNDAQKDGASLAQELAGSVPIIYSSERNRSLAYNWKIKFNETAKIPAFYNTVPELNHNEMTGFDVVESTRGLAERFCVCFLRDQNDDPRIQKRMDVTEAIYRENGIITAGYTLRGRSPAERIFLALLAADWTALGLSERYGTEAEQVPLVEDFKKRIL